MTSGHEYLPDQLKGAFSPIMHSMHKKSNHHFIFHESAYLLSDIYNLCSKDKVS